MNKIYKIYWNYNSLLLLKLNMHVTTKINFLESA